jgi:hypothetical protein
MADERPPLIPDLPPLEAKPAGKKEKEKQKEREREREKKQKERSERSLDTMLRTSYRMHVDMSGLADRKADIMISINGFIISILLAAIAPKVAVSHWLLLPTALVLVSCLVSLAFAVLAARPRVTRAKRDPSARPNLMFFGSFTTLTEDEFARGVDALGMDTIDLHGTMARDLYGLGKVLERKFALLHTAYTVFIAGLGVAVPLFIAVYAAIVLSGRPVP